MNYGTWTTLDCPEKKSNIGLCAEKLDELCKVKESMAQEVDKNIFISWRKISNPHDFGSYPSFELDCNVNELYDEDELNDNDNEEDFNKRDTIVAILNELEAEYFDYMNTLND